MQRRHAARVCSFLLPLILLLAACDGGLSSVQGATITPAPTRISVHRDRTIVQYCVDDTGSYPREDFHGANRLIAQNISDNVVANSEGFTLYATLINSKTFDPASTLAPFTIPSTPPYPALPAPKATPTEGNPISYAKEKQAAQAQNDAAIKAYNQQMAAVTQQLADLKRQVTDDTARLINLDPAVDVDATSVWGCLQRGRDRFKDAPGKHYLIIASDMENNTNVDFTADFAQTHALAGVTVLVVYFYCQNARACQATTAQWQRIFTNAGAASVTFADPAQSSALHHLFTGA
jgi:hypothetical protein